MDLKDLKQEWDKLEPEKKALIGLGIIVFVIVIYVFNPFHSSPDVQVVQDQPTDIQPVTSLPPAVTSNNSTNTTNMTANNGTFQIAADVAKNIALGANPGFTADNPTQGNVTINNTVVQVWIVPIRQGAVSKNIYVDLSSGAIVGSA